MSSLASMLLGQRVVAVMKSQLLAMSGWASHGQVMWTSVDQWETLDKSISQEHTLHAYFDSSSNLKEFPQYHPKKMYLFNVTERLLWLHGYHVNTTV